MGGGKVGGGKKVRVNENGKNKRKMKKNLIRRQNNL